jgi:hypothetical protein
MQQTKGKPRVKCANVLFECGKHGWDKVGGMRMIGWRGKLLNCCGPWRPS